MSSRLKEKFESRSTEDLRSAIASGCINKDSAPIAQSIIDEREAKASASAGARREEREEETLRIARDANSLAREAISVSRREARYAMYAAIIAAIAAIIEAKDEILAWLFG